MAGVERTKAVVRTVRTPRHGAKVPTPGVPDVEQTKGGTVGASVPSAVETVVGGRVGRAATTATDVSAEVCPSAGRQEVDATEAVDVLPPVGRAPRATIPHAEAEQGADPSVPVLGRATLPAVATQEARISGELGVAVPAVGRRQGAPA